MNTAVLWCFISGFVAKMMITTACCSLVSSPRNGKHCKPGKESAHMSGDQLEAWWTLSPADLAKVQANAAITQPIRGILTTSSHLQAQFSAEGCMHSRSNTLLASRRLLALWMVCGYLFLKRATTTSVYSTSHPYSLSAAMVVVLLLLLLLLFTACCY